MNGVLYLPHEGRYVLEVLESGGPRRFIGELQKLSTQGSPWASAALGYVSLRQDPQRNAGFAEQLCKTHADEGDPYAMFVLSWALFFGGDHWGATQKMREAMKSSFSPAMVDFARLVWRGEAVGQRDSVAALEALRAAHRAGHKAARLWMYSFYKSGRLGLGRQLLGYLLRPIAQLRLLVAVCADPFSMRVFVFQRKPARPLFKGYQS